jgi:leucyl/phenylalanyl-tRNA--protein transferase
MIRFLHDVPYLKEDANYSFPSPFLSTKEGIVCAGGNLSPGVVLSAYRQGLFPWFDDDSPLLWWSPDPRFVVLPETLHIPRSFAKELRRSRYTCTVDRSFSNVIDTCAGIRRKHQEGTWILSSMREAYKLLHSLGYAHSVEVWENDILVGGLYGVSLGKAFFGESMFSLKPGASRVGFLSLARFLFDSGFTFIDSQVHTDYVAAMGGVEIPRPRYLELLSEALLLSNDHGVLSRMIGEFQTLNERPGKDPG